MLESAVERADVSLGNYTSGGAVAALAPENPATRADLKGVEETLQLLGRAVRQLHTYPPSSPLCSDAIEATLRALVALDGPQQWHFRVHPQALIVHETRIGNGTIVGQEIAARLHRARVAAVTVERDCTTRDLLRFCLDLLAADDPRGAGLPFAERLAEHGVDKITAQMAPRPAVLQVGTPPRSVCDTLERQQAQREELFATGATVGYLYPPDKGWARLDPGSPLQTISISDLALLAEDPGVLAMMLMRLTDEELPQGDARAVALEQKFGDVATLFSSLDARLARTMFAKLARAVLALEPERRHALLRRTILPGLLDGGVDGAVLREFPDVDLADSLCLLLDLETAAPEVLATALDRLNLPDERRASMEPLLEERLTGARRDAVSSGRGTADEYARRLVKVTHAEAKGFAEFSAFDLSLDDQAMAARAELIEGIAATDVVDERLRCLTHLIRLEPNPVQVERFVRSAWRLLAGLERRGDWPAIAAWFTAQRSLAGDLREHRPDVADVLDAALAEFCTRDRALRIVELFAHDEDRGHADALLDAFGLALAPAFLDLLAAPANGGTPAVATMLSERAAMFAAAVVTWLDHPQPGVVRVAVRVLGAAGSGYERAIGSVLRVADDQTAREALRALARIGTPHAAALVAAQVREPRGALGPAAEETLWRFPAAESRRQVRELLGRREFVVRSPDVAARLLDRATQGGAAGLEQALAALAPLRFRFWNPGLVRVARKARALVS